jgi:hypothetical protein
MPGSGSQSGRSRAAARPGPLPRTAWALTTRDELTLAPTPSPDYS